MKLVDRYKREVQKKLHCDRETRRTLMDSFLPLLERYQEEETGHTWERLLSAFGTPEEMAASLMAKVPQEEQSRYLIRRKRRRIGLGIIAGILVALLLALTIFAFSTREVVVVQEGTIIVFDETIPTESEAGE